MGVPAFYSWLLRLLSGVEVTQLKQPCDNVYIDMNSVIHPACYDTLSSSESKSEEDMFEAVCRGVERIVAATNPAKMIYLAIDGVAPAAKMRQQRARRLRKIRDTRERVDLETLFRKEKELRGEPILAVPKNTEEEWDSNVITPGTEFMQKLSEHMEKFIEEKTKGDWKHLDVVFSDASVPGEGEHKMLDYIRQQGDVFESLLATQSDSKPAEISNFRHCIVGEDADLTMLGLATHKQGVVVARNLERQDALIAKTRRKNNRIPMNYTTLFTVLDEGEKQKETSPFRFILIDSVREKLQAKLEEGSSTPLDPADFENAIDDLLVLFFLGGNDFLPHLPTVDIREGVLSSFLEAYKKSSLSSREFIVDRETHQISIPALRKALLAIVESEESPWVELPANISRKLSSDDNGRSRPRSKWRPMPGMTQCFQFQQYKRCRQGSRCQRLHGEYIPQEQTMNRILSNLAAFVLTHSEPYLAEEENVFVSSGFGNGTFLLQDRQMGLLPSERVYHLRNLVKEEVDNACALAEGFGLTVISKSDTELKCMLPTFTSDDEYKAWAKKNRLVFKALYSEEVEDVFRMRENSQLHDARISDDMSLSLGKDKIKPDMYYQDKFDFDPSTPEGKEAIQNIVLDYVRGMQWNIRYYLEGLPSWDWYFPFHYAPFAFDLYTGMKGLHPDEYDSWPKTVPPTPVQQLIAVLPASSTHALPSLCARVLMSEDSPLSTHYPDPDDIELDPNGRRYRYQWVPLLPTTIDSASVEKVVEQTRSGWTPEELKRDRFSWPKYFSSRKDLHNLFQEDKELGAPALSLPLKTPHPHRTSSPHQFVLRRTLFSSSTVAFKRNGLAMLRFLRK